MIKVILLIFLKKYQYEIIFGKTKNKKISTSTQLHFTKSVKMMLHSIN
jgi:hypothetical protein